MGNWFLRPEQSNDVGAVRALISAAFDGVEHSDQSEARIVERLREDGSLSLALVAVDGEELVGHIAFSPVTIDARSEGWFGLGPLAVRPARQRQGIGSALIKAGLAHLRALGAHGCVVLGEPEYYRRFGFFHNSRLQLKGVAEGYFLTQAFGPVVPVGDVLYHPGFYQG